MSKKSYLACPMCSYTDQDADSLSRHVQAHLDNEEPTSVRTHLEVSCPLCDKLFGSPEEVQAHVSEVHDDLGGEDAVEVHDVGAASGSIANEMVCPVCHRANVARTPSELAVHVNSHFSEASSSTSDHLLAQDLDRREREKRKHQEAEEFAKLQAEYGMNGEGNFKQQTNSDLEKKVLRGDISVVEYHQNRIELNVIEASGIDSGRSVTKNCLDVIKESSSSSLNVASSYFCSDLDHFASAPGDRGWGCGYRNLQMMISAIVRKEPFQSHLSRHFPADSAAPAISKLQELIELAWRNGFDQLGCQQLGGKLHHTKKWIGATEVVTMFSYLGVRTQLLDFHAPTGANGTHPRLFDWVLRHFTTANFKSPLYFQHQGHSRTIVGVEKMTDGQTRLVIFDPSHRMMSKLHSKNKMEKFGTLRLLKKNINQIKSEKYQIVAVTGLLTPEEISQNKNPHSQRIP